jgi:hypothetical protein
MTATVHDGLNVLINVLIRATKRDIGIANVVFVLRRNGEPCATRDIAARFKDCSPQRMGRFLAQGVERGTVERDGNQWRVTRECVEAMRVHYRGWSDVFTEDDERRARGDLPPLKAEASQ